LATKVLEKNDERSTLRLNSKGRDVLPETGHEDEGALD